LLGWKKNAHHEEDGDVPLAKYIGETNIGLKDEKKNRKIRTRHKPIHRLRNIDFNGTYGICLIN